MRRLRTLGRTCDRRRHNLTGQPRPCAGPRERGTTVPTAEPEPNEPADHGDLCEAPRDPEATTSSDKRAEHVQADALPLVSLGLGFHRVVSPALGPMTRGSKDPSPDDTVAVKHPTLHNWKSKPSGTGDRAWEVPHGPGLSLPATLSRHSPPQYTRRAPRGLSTDASVAATVTS